MVSISDRARGGGSGAARPSWAVHSLTEGDLILGKNGRSAIRTFAERKTRFRMLLHLPKDHAAVTVRDAMITAMGQIQTLMCKPSRGIGTGNGRASQDRRSAGPGHLSL
jgi:hypothetical protein